MSPVSILVIIVTLLYFSWMIYRQYQQTGLRKNLIAEAYTAWQKADLESQQMKEKLLKDIANIYGENAAEKINQGKIWIGMPVSLLPLAAGKAQDVKESLYKNAKTEKWYYGRYVNRLGNAKYTLEVTIEDNTVAGWRDLQ